MQKNKPVEIRYIIVFTNGEGVKGKRRIKLCKCHINTRDDAAKGLRFHNFKQNSVNHAQTILLNMIFIFSLNNAKYCFKFHERTKGVTVEVG